MKLTLEAFVGDTTSKCSQKSKKIKSAIKLNRIYFPFIIFYELLCMIIL